MTKLARYHLVWTLVLIVVTGIVFGYAAGDWWKHGRPPIFHYWFQQLVVVCGAYRIQYHARAFNSARKK
jgi:uncharacterized membrane protein YfcA